MSDIKNIVFDFNGVLADIDKHKVVRNNVTARDFFNAFRFGFSYLTKKGFKQKIKSAYESFLTGKMSTAEVCDYVELCLSNSSNSFNKFLNNIGNSVEIRYQMIQLIKELRDYGFGVYILSNSIPQTAKIINSKEIKPYFDGVYCTSEKGKMKPNTDVYLEACKEWGILPEESMFIDDKQKNLDGAKKAGFKETYLAEDEEQTYYGTFNQFF